jgi:hypothetical protein
VRGAEAELRNRLEYRICVPTKGSSSILKTIVNDLI